MGLRGFYKMRHHSQRTSVYQQILPAPALGISYHVQQYYSYESSQRTRAG
jgi:hypothetical protein